MPTAHRNANPFAMMLDPQAVLASVAHSDRLSRLQRRVCRPLDRPMLGRVGTAAAELAEFDSAVDSEGDEALDPSDELRDEDRAA